MRFTETLSLMPDSFLFWLLIALVATLALYFTREPGHRAILHLGKALNYVCRLGAASMIRAEQHLQLRNREVLLAAGREEAERHIEREFERLEASVQRDLAQCPSLHRKIQEQVTQIEEDLQASVEVPPAPPGWVNAVQAVAQIPDSGDGMVSKILENIHQSLIKAQEQALDEYRGATQERHAHLKSMMPHWRKLIDLVGQADKRANKIMDHAKVIDRHMDEYSQILRQDDRAVRKLSSSSLVDFLIAVFVLSIAIGGAVINFHLIARPMAEMVGGNTLIGAYKTADIAALVIILVEITMGLFLMECLRITRLFPVIGALSDKLRKFLGLAAFCFLFGLASVEAGLAYMREILVQDELATSALLRGEAAGSAATSFQWITTLAQMGMGFILPFALTFVAIPLETFFKSLRTVAGLVSGAALKGFAVALRLTGGFFKYISELLIDLYDLFIFFPLWVERQFKNGHSQRKPKTAHAQERY